MRTPVAPDDAFCGVQDVSRCRLQTAPELTSPFDPAARGQCVDSNLLRGRALNEGRDKSYGAWCQLPHL